MTTPELYVRACPEQLELVETYRYRFDIANASSISPIGQATGKLQGVFPYQASEWLLQDASREPGLRIATGRSRDPDFGDLATVGHLVFADWEGTNLEARLTPARVSGTETLRIPGVVRRAPREGDSSAHRRAAAVELDYLPEAAHASPLQLKAEILDRETLEAQEVVELTRSSELDVQKLATKLAQRPEGSPGLLLVLRLQLTLEHARVGAAADVPFVRCVSLHWPTIPWPGSLFLVNFDRSGPRGRTFQYNPESRTVEWTPQLPMDGRTEGAEASRQGVISRWSTRIVISLDEVADLAGETHLTGRLEVNVPGSLASGLDVRHYDATGAQVRRGPQLETRIVADLRLGLEHLLRRRTRSIVHRLFLEGVRLDDRRVADVCSTFVDCGLTVRKRWRSDGGEGGAVVVIDGERLMDGEPLHLIACLQGHRHSAVRTTELAGGRSYRTTLETGDVDLTLHGLLRGARDSLCNVVDAVHGRLRDVFGATADHR